MDDLVLHLTPWKFPTLGKCDHTWRFTSLSPCLSVLRGLLDTWRGSHEVCVVLSVPVKGVVGPGLSSLSKQPGDSGKPHSLFSPLFSLLP